MKTNIFPANSAPRIAFGATAPSGIPSLTARLAAYLAFRRKPSTPVASVFLAAGILGFSALPGRAADGDLDSSFNPNVGSGTSAAVYGLAVQPDGKILLGGGFQTVGGQPHSCIARVNANGTVDAGFNTSAPGVYSLAVQDDGQILLGGGFDTVNGIPRGQIARVYSDGTLDAGFNPNAIGFESDDVLCMALQADGRILLGGLFTSVSGVTRVGIARVYPDGTLDAGFYPGTGGDFYIYSLAVQADGKILLGGRFNSVGSTERHNIARVHADGTLDTSFNPNVEGGTYTRVSCMAVQADGKILLGGDFTTVGGTTRNNIARLHADGTLDTGFNPNVGGTTGDLMPVRSLAVQVDGKIVMGGNFGMVGGASRSCIARLNADGTLDTSCHPNTDGAVYGVALQADGKILLGGKFTMVNGGERNHIARLLNGPATQTLGNAGAEMVQWLRSGTAPEVEQVTFALSVDGGASWTPLGAGTRISGGWNRIGLSLPPGGLLRARGRATGGYDNGSSSVIEQVTSYALPAEIGVLVDGSNLVDGVSTVQFGIVPPGQTGLTKTFTVSNAGPGNLTLGTVTLSDSAAGDYLLDTSGMAGMLAEDESTTFAVTFRPTAHDLRSAKLHIANNDGNESPFDVTLSGTQVRADGDFDSSTNGTVYGMAVQPDGKIMLGGNFTSVCGVPRNHIARLHADGTLDTAFDPNANGIVYTLAVQADGKMLVGGSFTSVGGTACTGFGRLNANGTLDTAFNPNVGAAVLSVMVQTDGKILIGGVFTTVGGLERNHLARIHIDGTLDTGFNPNVSAYGPCSVNSLAVQPDGRILLGGTFRLVSGIARNYAARVHADGTLDTGFNPNVELVSTSSVDGLAVQPDGKILLVGGFLRVGGEERRHIARLHVDGTVDMGFDPAANANVHSMTMQTDGKILISGWFNEVDQIPRPHIARLNSNGTLDSSFNPDADQRITSVVVQNDGRILVGGDFTSVGGAASNRIARLLNDPATQVLNVIDGTQVQWLRGGSAPELDQVVFEVSVNGGSYWALLGNGSRVSGGWAVNGLSLPPTGSVRARGRALGGYGSVSSSLIRQVVDYTLPDIAVQVDGSELENGVGMVSSGTIPLGEVPPTFTFTIRNSGGSNLTLGSVTLAGSHAADFVPDTSALAATLAPGETTMFTLAFRPTGDGLRSATLQIASNDADESPFYVALSGTQTREDNAFNPNPDGYVGSVAVQADGKILLGGGFTTVCGVPRNYLARLNADGTLDSGFDPNANNSVNCTAVQTDGKILLGGLFTAVGGTTRNRIARVNPDGTLDTGFNPNANDWPGGFAVQADGKIVVAGTFTTVGGVARNHVARLNSNGTLDTGFNPNASHSVSCVAVQADGKVLLGGNFATIGGTARDFLARVNANGTLDAAFNPNVSSTVTSMIVQADGKILLGGNFTNVGGVARSRIARLHADGTLDTGFNPSANGIVRTMALQTDGKILLGGFFTTMNGVARQYIARLYADGTLDTSLQQHADSYVSGVALQPDGKILLGGQFTTVGGLAHNRIARLLNEPATLTLRVPDVTQLQWLRGGTSPEIEQTTFELSVDGGSNWMALGSGARISGGWSMTGLSLPTAGSIRARGRATGGGSNGDSSLIEQIAGFVPSPNIGVMVDGSDLTDGVGTVDFGTLQVGQTGPTRTFTVTNTGAADLTLGALTLGGPAAADYLLDISGLTGTVAPGGSTTFTVTFRPSGDGLRSATLQIASNDIDEAPFDIALSGTQTRVDSVFTASVDGWADSVAVQADGKILLGGGFYTVCGVARNNLARLHADGTLDTGFDPNPNGHVSSVAVQADGKILLGGGFTTVCGVLRNRLARLNADGTLDTSFDPNADAYVSSIAIRPDGKILIAGEFINVGGVMCLRIARLHADGTPDTGFIPPHPDNAIHSLALQADGKILLAGPFSKMGSRTRNGIARLYSDGYPDHDFVPSASGVRSMIVQADGKILLGGSFNTINGTERNGIARLHADGTLDTGFDPNPNGHVESLALQADGKIVLGGDFSNVGGTAGPFVARLHPDGTPDSGFASGMHTYNAFVQSVALQADGKVLVLGEFTSVGGEAHRGIARLLNEPAIQTFHLPDNSQVQWLRGGTAPEIEQVTFELSTDGGTTWTALNSGWRIAGGWETNNFSLPNSGSIRARGRATGGSGNASSSVIEQVGTYVLPDIEVWADGDNLVDGVGSASFGTGVYGGSFPPMTFTVTNVGAAYLTLGAITISGAEAADYLLDTSGLAGILAPGASTTFTVAFHPGGDTWRRANLQIANNDGDESPFDILLTGMQSRADNSFYVAANYAVSAVAVQPDGKILLGGSFTSIAGVPCNYIARVNADGTLDESFAPNVTWGSTYSVYGIAVQADGKILIVGSFRAVSGTLRNYIARLNADGTLDADFEAKTNDPIHSVAVQSDGKILLGGLFTAVGLTPRNYIARLNADGSLDSGFDPSASSGVETIAVQPDGKILLGGTFTTIGGTARNRVARLNADGTLDSGFDPDANDRVRSMALQADGKILLGGEFNALSGTLCRYVARVHADGTFDSGFNPETGGYVSGMALQADGGILLGCTTGRRYITRLLNEPAIRTLEVTEATEARWLCGGTAPEIEQVTFELSLDSGATWMPLGNGARSTGGWTVSGLNLPLRGLIRMRGRATAGIHNGGSSLIEQMASYVLPIPGINVQVDGTDLVDGAGTVSFGSVTFGQAGPTRTFTVTNIGGANLTLGTVTLGGSAAGDYSPDITGMAAELAPEESTTFTVAFLPTADGVRNASLQLASNDPDESPFDIALSGTRTRVDGGFGPGADATVHSVVVQADGKILLGGMFEGLGGSSGNYLVRLLADGTLDTGFIPNPNNSVNCLAVQADGKILLGGSFTNVGGIARNSIARVHGDGTLDTGFDPNVNGTVISMAIQADGKILLVGNFTTVGGTAQYYLARLHADGTPDNGFIPNMAFGKRVYVYSVAVQADGMILLGCRSVNVAGVLRNGIARFHADGTLDTDFNPNAGGTVECLALQPDGKILLGGGFTSVGGTARSNIARLNADGTLDTGFNPDADSTITSLALQADGKVLLGGLFTHVNGTERHFSSRLHADGSLDTGFDPDANSYVYSVALQADGKVLLGGNFTSVSGVACGRIARLLNEPASQTLGVVNATQVQWLRGGTAAEVEQVTFDLSVDSGSTWTALGSATRITGGWAMTGLSLPVSGSVRAHGRAPGGHYDGSSSMIEQVLDYVLPDIAVAVDGANLVDGVGTVSFGTVLVGQTGPTLTFTVTNDGGLNLTLEPITLSGSEAADYQLDTSSFASVLAPGESTTFTVTFDPTGDGLRSATLQLASNDPDESPFDIALSGTRKRVEEGLNLDVNGNVFGAALQTDGKILLGGTFTRIGGLFGMTRNRIARLHADGTLDTDFNPNANGAVYGVVLQADRRILVCGGFTSVGGVLRNRIARLNADGTLDTGFNPNPNGEVNGVVMQDDGRILIYGSFTNIGGVLRNRIARLNPDGTLDTSFNPDANGIVQSLAVQADGQILLGGNFTSVGGVARSHIARLSPGGTPNPGFDPNTDLGVSSVVVQADGRILLGGSFATVGGVTRNCIARLHADGTLDTGFDPDADNTVNTMAVQADGKILLGGVFTSIGGMESNYFAQIHPDGTLDSGLHQDANSIVNGVTVQADGKILLVGNFTSLGGEERSRVARLLNEPATQTLLVPDATQVQWLRGGTTAEIEQVTFEVRTDGETIWADLGSAARITGGWALTGLNLPLSGTIRARGRVTGGYRNGSTSRIQQVVDFALPTPEIAVQVDGTDLVDGAGSVEFGTVQLGQTSPPATVTIINSGEGNLTLGNFTLTGSGAGDYVLDTSGLAALVPPGENTTFTVSFRPTADGTRNATLQIANNDADEAPFDVALSGTRTRVDGIAFNPEVGGSVIRCAALQADGKILIGGDFTTLGGMPQCYLARINADGSLEAGFNPEFNTTWPYTRIECIVVQKDGKIVVGGSFASVGGEPRSCLARLNADGSLDPGFDPSPDNEVCSMAMQADGKLLLCGLFSTVCGTERHCLARLNPDGSLDADFNPPSWGYVCSVALQADGKVLLGGARLHSDGTLDSGFTPNVMGSVETIAMLADGRILLGGNFNEVGGIARSNIALLDEDGTVIPDFNPAPNGAVQSVAVQADGTILVGGSFTSIGGVDRSGVALLNADGVLNLAFNPVIERVSYYTSVFGLTIQRDGKVLVTGNFSTVDGMECSCITRLLNEPATQSINVADPTHVQWLRGGTAPEIEQATFELSVDNGVTWVPLGSGATRISGGWAEEELSLPASGLIRARGRATGGQHNGSSSLIEQVSGYALPAGVEITRFVRNMNGSFTIEWIGGGTLQSSETLEAWEDVVGATSPYTFTSNRPKLFLRIRW